MAKIQTLTLPKDFFSRFGKETALLYIVIAGDSDDEGFVSVSDRALASKLGVTRSQIRKSVKELVENHFITTPQPPCNQSATTSQPEEGVHFEPAKSDIDIRKEAFYKTLVPYIFNQQTGQGYPPDMLRAFFDYWSEPNQAGKKMRFEMEKTWSIEGRLRTWASRDKNFNNNRNNGTELNTKAQREFEAMCADTARGIARRSKIVLPDDLI